MAINAGDWTDAQVTAWCRHVLTKCKIKQAGKIEEYMTQLEEQECLDAENLGGGEVTLDTLTSKDGVAMKHIHAKKLFAQITRVFTGDGATQWDSDAANGRNPTGKLPSNQPPAQAATAPPAGEPGEVRRPRPANMGTRVRKPEEKPFQIVISRGNGRQIVIPETQNFKRGSKLAKLFTYLEDNERLKDYTVCFKRKQFNPRQHKDTKFQEIGVEEGSRNVHMKVVFKVGGGAKSVAPDLEGDSRFQIVSDSTPCMVYHMGDADFPRVKMSCGHVISRDGLYYLVDSILKNGLATIMCCEVSCKTEWDFDVCCKIGKIKGKEKMEKELRLEHNLACLDKSQKPCPFCHKFTQRPDESTFRIACGYCRRDFCWRCFGQWKGAGSTNCGNEDCGYASINKQLRECPRKNVLRVAGVPETRACPNCVEPVLITHGTDDRDGCKYVSCFECSKGFCHVCLCTAKDDGKSSTLPCGGHCSVCPVAPVQQFS